MFFPPFSYCCLCVLSYLSIQLFSHQTNFFVLRGNRLLQLLDFAILLEGLFLELLLERCLILVCIVGEPLGVLLLVCVPVGLLVDLRHDLVAEHLGVQDAIKGTILGRFTALVFLLVDCALVVVFEDSEHLLKFAHHG